MKIFLIRHAQAVDGPDDAVRPLTTKGRNDARRMGRFLGRTMPDLPRVLLHSGLVRAEETARLLAKEIGMRASCVRACGCLLPEDDPCDLAARIDRMTDDQVFVGHEPHLSALATLLVRGKDADPIVEMKKSAVLCLERENASHRKSGLHRWRILWLVTPGLIAEAGRSKRA